MTDEPIKTEIMFVPHEKVRQACADINTTSDFNGRFKMWVSDAHYLKDDKSWALTIKKVGSYPFVENALKEKWSC